MDRVGARRETKWWIVRRALGGTAGVLLASTILLTGCAGPATTPAPSMAPRPLPEPLTSTGTGARLDEAEVVAELPVPAVPAPAATVAARTVEVGHSVQGTPLTLEIYGDGPETIFIFAGIHGSEPSGTVLARQFMTYLRQHPEELAGRTIAILPVANPDGLAVHTYGNARNVNVNRNFPARNWKASDAKRRGPTNGPQPCSEPETLALMQAVDLLKPQRIVSIHSIQRGRHCDNYDGPARELAELMSGQNRYPVKANIGYPTPGSFGSWAGNDRGIPTITLELPNDAGSDECWRDNAGALLAFVRGASGQPPTAATGK